MADGTIVKVSGPVVQARMKKVKMYDLVHVGEKKLMGEVIQLWSDIATIQVYEETSGLKPGEPVENTERPFSVELGPGLLANVFDGTQRPLTRIRKEFGIFIAKGVNMPALDEAKKWEFNPLVKKGDIVKEGDVLGTVDESSLIVHKILVPLGLGGKVSDIKKGKFTVKETIATIDKTDVQMRQYWPVRKPRPVRQRLVPQIPLITGFRVLDTFFPMLKGGAAAIPGPFGAGKTVTQQSLAKWCDAQVIVYIGCGERGNEMTEVLEEFPHLVDPKTGKPLMDRTILIANTSNMPVAAREASVYTGITIAEYYRDMGYNVALMADSTSRWAEAMREISGRLEEMPGEEGYPAYLGKRLAEFYERAGRGVVLMGSEASISVIGAVSPAGGDFSEPVTQNTLRNIKAFWALDAKLADKRHFPSINWLNSYSLYLEKADDWFAKNVDEAWPKLRSEAMKVLQKESELKEIVQLVGPEALGLQEQVIMLVAKMIREDFLQQNAFHEVDSFCSLKKQFAMLDVIMSVLRQGTARAAKGKDVREFSKSDTILTIAQMKYESELKFFKNVSSLKKQIEMELKA